MREKMGKSHKIKRAPRIRVPNNERALFVVDAQKLVGVVQRLSLTGGSVILSKGPVPPGTLGEMGLNTVFGKVTAQIQFLQTRAEGIPLAQAFQFLDMDEVSSRRFAAAAAQMQSEGFSDADDEEKSLSDVASQALNKLRTGFHHVSAVISSSRRTRA
ncbi:MAG: hypothetical protein WB952_19120 [Terriglobales bacterium]